MSEDLKESYFVISFTVLLDILVTCKALNESTISRIH